METLTQIWESIVSFFRVNRGIKLVSLLLAILLWLYVVANNVYVYPIEVPIRVVNIPPGKTLASEIPESATIRFRGKGTILFKAMLTMPYSDIYLRLDLRRVDSTRTFRLPEYLSHSPGNFVISRGYNLEMVDLVRPEEITVRLDSTISRIIPVFSKLQVTPAPGYTQVGPVRFSPDSIMVTGPAMQVSQIDSIPTERRNFEQLDTREEGAIALINPDGELIHLSAKETHYLIDIQTISERKVTDIPIRIRNAPPNLDVTTAPSTVTLTLEGGSEYIFSLEPDNIPVYIDFAEIWEPDKTYYVPQVEPPQYVLRWRDMSPRQVEVVVRRE